MTLDGKGSSYECFLMSLVPLPNFSLFTDKFANEENVESFASNNLVGSTTSRVPPGNVETYRSQCFFH